MNSVFSTKLEVNMYIPRLNEKFRKQCSNILFYTQVLCQDINDRNSILKATKWIESQKTIPYLPNADMFTYYCPICNHTLTVGYKCKQCNQLIEWHEDMLPKLISE